MSRRNFILVMLVEAVLLPFVISINTLVDLSHKKIEFNTWTSSSFYEKRAIVETGDTLCYKHVLDSIRKNSPYGDYFYYSFVMAMKHDYIPANYDVYCSLYETFSPANGVGEIDEKTKRIAMYFLERGAALGDQRCKEVISTGAALSTED